jgi:hypothetical protein
MKKARLRPRWVEMSERQRQILRRLGADLSAFDQWNCSSSVEPVRAFTLEEPPWITVVTSSK